MSTRLLTLPAALLLTATLAACGSEPDQATESEPEADGTTTECSYPEDPAGASAEVTPPPSDAPATGEVSATLATSAGDIGATLDAEATPCATNSFVSLAEQGYFDDTRCHRLTTADSGIFVLQCGDPTASGSGGPGYSFADELTGQETYPAGTIAMANAGPDTNGSQFFLVYEETPLPPDYVVLGRMDDAGLGVVREVAEAGVQGGGPDGPPASEVVIESVTTG